MEFMNPARYSLSFALALFFVLMVIGVGIRKQAYRAVAPPIYDPLEYIKKGKEVWSLIARGSLTGILNAPPPSRPPGCVPFCYPFGYRADFRSFLFWSTFSPLILWAFSIYLALGSCERTLGEHVLPVGWGVGLISLPMFYHFELSGANESPFIGQWGLQDCLLASMGALATITTIIGARKRLFFLSMLGWAFAAYSLFIKPAGILIMLSVAWVWLIEMAISRLQSSQRLFKAWLSEVQRYALLTILAGVAIFGFAIISAFSSDYLSADNIYFSRTSLGILRSLYGLTELIPIVTSSIRPVIGWWWAAILGIACIVALVAGMRRAMRKQFSPNLVRALGAFMIILASGYWWIFMAGLQARYYFPFILMVIIWLVPDLLQYLSTLSHKWRILLATPPVLMTFGLVGLLWSDSQMPRLERMFGVNLSAGGFLEEVQLGRHLMDESRKVNRNLQIYSAPSVRAGVVYSVDYLNSISCEEPLLLNFILPLDWTRAPGIRLDEILASNYLFFEENASPASPVKIETFSQEISAYHCWLGTLDEQQGVIRVKTGPLNVLRVQNKEQLRSAFLDFVGQHQWREIFIQNNAEVFSNK